MKMFYISCCAALLLTACQNKVVDDGSANDEALAAIEDAAKADLNAVKTPAPMKVSLDGRIRVSPENLVSESDACILPLRVTNGTEAEVSVSMFSFQVTGSGTDDTGNMFAQPTPSGEARTARVILIGQTCSAFDTVTISEVLCVSGDAPCPVSVEFEDSSEMKLIGPN